MQPATVKKDRQQTVPRSGEVHSCTAFGSGAVQSLPAMQIHFIMKFLNINNYIIILFIDQITILN
jgi:hypothetical protein